VSTRDPDDVELVDEDILWVDTLSVVCDMWGLFDIPIEYRSDPDGCVYCVGSVGTRGEDVDHCGMHVGI